jgi:hypothetical protein
MSFEIPKYYPKTELLIGLTSLLEFRVDIDLNLLVKVRARRMGGIGAARFGSLFPVCAGGIS